MIGLEFDGLAWPPGDEWPPGVLPPPTLTLEISVLELEGITEQHDKMARESAADHEHETELFFRARASYLRQRLAVIAPQRVAPHKLGNA